MARDGRIPAQKAGREWRFLRRKLEEWLEGSSSHTVVAETETSYGQQMLFDDDTRPTFKRPIEFGDTAFTKNRREPLHRWVPWIAGFSAAFVEEVFDSVIEDHPSRVTILDPFAGVGTTLVEGIKRGYNVIGFDINPYAALASRVKLNAIDIETRPLVERIHQIELYARGGVPPDVVLKTEPPAGFRSKRAFFSPSIERQVLMIKDIIDSETEADIKALLKVAFGSVMVSFSNYTYEPSLGTRVGAGKPEIQNANAFRILADKLWEMEADIGYLQRHMERFEHRPNGTVHPTSFLDGAKGVETQTVDALVTSPPYLNNYHYVRNTRPQLYWLDLTDGNGSLKEIETANFGQFWQNVRSGPKLKLRFDLPELDQLLDTIRVRNPEKGVYGGSGWANYAARYFNDTDRFFRVAKRVMKPQGRIVVVIGNNIVQGVHVETDRFLAEIGEKHGFTLVNMHRVRKKRTGSSIVNSSVRAGTMKKRVELYETAVEMAAPDR